MHALTPLPRQPFVPAQAYEVLQHPTRVALLESLRIEGPANTLTLADEFGISTLKLRHHVRHLADAGLVRLRKTREGECVTFSPIGWARLKKKWSQGLRPLEGRGGLRLRR